jgi:hypothetical protein
VGIVYLLCTRFSLWIGRKMRIQEEIEELIEELEISSDEGLLKDIE